MYARDISPERDKEIRQHFSMLRDIKTDPVLRSGKHTPEVVRDIRDWLHHHDPSLDPIRLSLLSGCSRFYYSDSDAERTEWAEAEILQQYDRSDEEFQKHIHGSYSQLFPENRQPGEYCIFRYHLAKKPAGWVLITRYGITD